MSEGEVEVVFSHISRTYNDYICIRVPRELKERIEDTSRRYGLNRSEFIRIAVMIALYCPKIVTAIKHMAVLSDRGEEELAKKYSRELLCRYRQELLA